MRKLSILIALVLLVPAAAQAKSLDELLVDKGIITKAEAMAAHGGGAKVYYKGGTRIEFPDQGFSVKINTQLQPRYEFTDNDDGVDNVSSFRMRRARVQLSGHALNKEFSYKLQYDLVGRTAGDGSRAPNLRDAYLNWHACDTAWIRMGQWKTGVSRQYNNSSAKLQIADRSRASDYFDLGRQNGAGVGGEVMDGQVSWTASVYNGSSTGEGINRGGVDTNHAGVVTLRADLMGEMNAHSEGDVDWTDDAAVNAGLAYAYSDDNVAGLGQDHHSFNADVNFKYQGWSLFGEFYYSLIDPDGTGSAGDIEDIGFYVQGGYFIQPKKLEIAARVGYIDFEDDAGSAAFDDETEASASINYYWWKHQLKAQLGYAFVTEGGRSGSADVDTSRWFLQLSSWF